MQVTIERVLEDRDVDAALYLLDRILGSQSPILHLARRRRLEGLQSHVQTDRHLTAAEKKLIVSEYREIIG